MQESTRNLVIGIIVVVVVVGAIWYLVSQQGGQQAVIPQGPLTATTTQGTVVAPGASSIASSGQVVTPQGAPVKLDVAPGSPQAPQESAPIAAQSIPKADVIKITAITGGWSPNTFTVKAGELVNLVVSDGDQLAHVFAFQDPSLSAVAVGVGPGDANRIISFNAPTKTGTYTFFNNIPGRNGETGTMVVK